MAGNEVLRLSGLPDLSQSWLRRALETEPQAVVVAAHASRGPVDAADPGAALQLVVSCFPSIDFSGLATATRGEQELLFELFLRQRRLYGDDTHKDDDSTAVVTQLAVAAVNYCRAQLQAEVCNFSALLPIADFYM